jgi:hypothetical protein
MGPVSSFDSDSLVIKCKKYQNGMMRKQQQQKGKQRQKNTQFNYLPK